MSQFYLQDSPNERGQLWTLNEIKLRKNAPPRWTTVSALKGQQTSVLRVRCASFFKRLYIVTVPVLCPNFSMTASFLVTKKGDSNILKFVINYTYALKENIYRKFWFTTILPKTTTLIKNVIDFYPKFHFPFKRVSSVESTMVWTAIAFSP